MASVRLSKELITRIVTAAREKMTPAVVVAKELAKVDNAWGQRIYDTLFGEVRPLVDQLPTGWVAIRSNFSVRAVGDLECDLSFSLSPPQPWPAIFPDTELASPHSSFIETSIRLKNHLVWGELYAEVSTKQKRIREAVTRQREFVKAVEQILYTYTTLNQACTVWPPLWELVPQEVKLKCPDLPERRSKVKERPDVDLDKLTAVFAVTKLGV